MAWLFRPGPAESSHCSWSRRPTNRSPRTIRRNPAATSPTIAVAQQELIQSDDVLRMTTSDPQVAALPVIKSQSDPIAWLKSRLQVDFPDHSEIMRVTLSVSQCQRGTGT